MGRAGAPGFAQGDAGVAQHGVGEVGRTPRGHDADAGEGLHHLAAGFAQHRGIQPARQQRAVSAPAHKTAMVRRGQPASAAGVR